MTNCCTFRHLNLVIRALPFGDVAQLGEHRLCKPGVAGSIPVVSTDVMLELVVKKSLPGELTIGNGLNNIPSPASDTHR